MNERPLLYEVSNLSWADEPWTDIFDAGESKERLLTEGVPAELIDSLVFRHKVSFGLIVEEQLGGIEKVTSLEMIDGQLGNLAELSGLPQGLRDALKIPEPSSS